MPGLSKREEALQLACYQIVLYLMQLEAGESMVVKLKGEELEFKRIR